MSTNTPAQPKTFLSPFWRDVFARAVNGSPFPEDATPTEAALFDRWLAATGAAIAIVFGPIAALVAAYTLL